MTTSTMPPVELISRDIDIFPAKLIADPNTDTPTSYGKVRARFTRDNRLMVWQEQETFPHQASLVIDTFVTAIQSNTIGDNSVIRRQQSITLTTTKGRVVTISPQSGCGCGSRLKQLSNAQLNGQAYQPIRPMSKSSPTRNLPEAIQNNWPI